MGIFTKTMALGGVALAMGLALATSASAVTLNPDSDRYRGAYSPGASGNDPFPRNLVIGEAIDSAALYKCDREGSACVNDADNFVSSLGYQKSDITFTFDSDFKSGTFTLALSGDEKLLPHYLAIKAGTGFTVYDIAGLDTATWTTVGLLNDGGNQPGLSHLSFYNSEPGLEPIPLPAAGWMLIAGIAGLAAAGRRRIVA